MYEQTIYQKMYKQLEQQKEQDPENDWDFEITKEEEEGVKRYKIVSLKGKNKWIKGKNKWIEFKFERNDFSLPFSLKVYYSSSEGTTYNFDPKNNTFNKPLYPTVGRDSPFNKHTFCEVSSVMSIPKFNTNSISTRLYQNYATYPTYIDFLQDEVSTKALDTVQKANQKSLFCELKYGFFGILFLAVYFEYVKVGMNFPLFCFLLVVLNGITDALLYPYIKLSKN